MKYKSSSSAEVAKTNLIAAVKNAISDGRVLSRAGSEIGSVYLTGNPSSSQAVETDSTTSKGLSKFAIAGIVLLAVICFFAVICSVGILWLKLSGKRATWCDRVSSKAGSENSEVGGTNRKAKAKEPDDEKSSFLTDGDSARISRVSIAYNGNGRNSERNHSIESAWPRQEDTESIYGIVSAGDENSRHDRGTRLSKCNGIEFLEGSTGD